ncbi:MAG: hypothetical protein AAFU70_10900, partial [Planctomycetota bacterium]
MSARSGLVRAVFAVSVVPAGAASAQINGNVQWGSLSHVGDTDRRSLVPLERESFDVVFQTAHGDATSARVLVDKGHDGVVDARDAEAFIRAMLGGFREADFNADGARDL